MKRILTALLMSLSLASIFSQGRMPVVKENIPLDSIYLSDPCILADKSTATYYMTGTGGLLWKSKDLKRWTGPYVVTKTDPESWMGPQPMIWAAELHQYMGKYYYFATFTNRRVIIDTVRGNVINRRASHILVSEQAIAQAIATCWSRYGERVEGSAAVTLAAVLSGAVPERPAVLVMSGGNIQPELYEIILSENGLQR